jgi:hypothetical protein
MFTKLQIDSASVYGDRQNDDLLKKGVNIDISKDRVYLG